MLHFELVDPVCRRGGNVQARHQCLWCYNWKSHVGPLPYCRRCWVGSSNFNQRNDSGKFIVLFNDNNEFAADFPLVVFCLLLYSDWLSLRRTANWPGLRRIHATFPHLNFRQVNRPKLFKCTSPALSRIMKLQKFTFNQTFILIYAVSSVTGTRCFYLNSFLWTKSLIWLLKPLVTLQKQSWVELKTF